jgi:hypothetical protein
MTEFDQSYPDLAISTEKVCFIIAKAREFQAKDVVTIPDNASNPTDDRMAEVLEDRSDDPVFLELGGFIAALNQDEQLDLVTLAWLGRGDAGAEGWNELRDEAARSHDPRTTSHLLGLPLLPELLCQAELNRSCEEFERL